MHEPRLFTVHRQADESGVSGTGRVLDGVVFHTGQVVVCWRTDIEAAAHGHSSIAVYASWKAFVFIHLGSHPTNHSRVEWLNKGCWVEHFGLPDPPPQSSGLDGAQPLGDPQ